jgi:murein DD-endopeptidase MepM/ murein hydrolase activator NlpD
VITLAANVLVILLIVAWVWRARAASRLEAGLVAAIAAAAVAFTWLQSPLSVLFGPAWPGAFALLAAAGGVRLARRSQALAGRPPDGVRSARIIVPALALALMLFENALVVAGRSTPDNPIALDWPLRGGTFRVMHGGRSAFINSHAGIEAQKYAIDVLAVNRLGFRATGFAPAELSAYEIYDTPVHAPCAGEIVAARDGMSDGTRATEPPQLAGNFAAIYCEGVTVLLAHFRQGSLAVKAGDMVAAGQPIGRVGNSGNSSEPHLHIHANRGRVADPVEMVTTAVGVPMTFAGRFLVRNDVVKS